MQLWLEGIVLCACLLRCFPDRCLTMPCYWPVLGSHDAASLLLVMFSRARGCLTNASALLLVFWSVGRGAVCVGVLLLRDAWRLIDWVIMWWRVFACIVSLIGE